MRKGIVTWLTLDMIVFVAVNIFLILYFQSRFSSLDTIGFFRFLVLGLAAYRAANIVSNEKITKPLRAPFVNESQKEGKTIEEPKKAGFMGAMGQLIYCPSCTGVWLAAILVYGYIFYPEPTFLVALFLALSGIERIISAVLAWLKSYERK